MEGVDKEATTIMLNAGIPWWCMGRMVADGYTTLLDLADRWVTKESCREKCADDMEVKDGQNGFHAAVASRTIVRMAQAVQVAKSRVQRRNSLSVLPMTDTVARQVIEAVSREALEDAFSATAGGRKPPLKDQGNDTFLGKLFHSAQNGALAAELCDNRHVVPHLPDPDAQLHRKEVTSHLAGHVEREERTESEDPGSREALSRIWAIKRITLSMAVDSQPQHSNIQLSHEAWEKFYE